MRAARSSDVALRCRRFRNRKIPLMTRIWVPISSRDWGASTVAVIALWVVSTTRATSAGGLRSGCSSTSFRWIDRATNTSPVRAALAPPSMRKKFCHGAGSFGYGIRFLEEAAPNAERGHDPDDDKDRDPEIRRESRAELGAPPVLAGEQPEPDQDDEGDDVLLGRARVEDPAHDPRDHGEAVVGNDLDAAVGHAGSVRDPGPPSSARRYVVIAPRPLTSTCRSSTANRPSSNDRVDSASWIRPGTPEDSIRAAVFTVAPQRTNTIRRVPMITPTTAPLARPIRICRSSPLASRQEATSSSMARAKATAASAWSARASGAPAAAM